MCVCVCVYMCVCACAYLVSMCKQYLHVAIFCTALMIVIAALHGYVW